MEVPSSKGDGRKLVAMPPTVWQTKKVLTAHLFGIGFEDVLSISAFEWKSNWGMNDVLTGYGPSPKKCILIFRKATSPYCCMQDLYFLFIWACRQCGLWEFTLFNDCLKQKASKTR